MIELRAPGLSPVQLRHLGLRLVAWVCWCASPVPGRRTLLAPGLAGCPLLCSSNPRHDAVAVDCANECRWEIGRADDVHSRLTRPSAACGALAGGVHAWEASQMRNGGMCDSLPCLCPCESLCPSQSKVQKPVTFRHGTQVAALRERGQTNASAALPYTAAVPPPALLSGVHEGWHVLGNPSPAAY